jgi:Mrp family chromosome partitioning ATPase
MREFLIHTEQIYDYVVIDSAPIVDIADTSVLGPYVDGVLFVMRPGKTPRRLAGDAKDKLNGMGARVLGVVLNHPTKALHNRYNRGFGRYSYGNYMLRDVPGLRGGPLDDEFQAEPAVPTPRFLLPPARKD